MGALLETVRTRAQAGNAAEAAALGETAVLAVGSPSVQAVIQQVGDWSGKILIDATNRVEPA